MNKTLGQYNAKKIVTLKKIHPISFLWGSYLGEKSWLHNAAATKNFSLNQLKPRNLSSLEITPNPKIAKKNVIYIQLESFRDDLINLVYKNKEITPNLNALAKQSLFFPHAYSTSTHTSYARPSTVSSLLMNRGRFSRNITPYNTLPYSLVYEILKKNGYATGFFASDDERWQDMVTFFNPKWFDNFFDSSNESTKLTDPKIKYFYYNNLRRDILPDDYTTSRAMQWLNAQKGKPFFLYLLLEASHFPYDLPKYTQKLFPKSELNSQDSFFSYALERRTVAIEAYYSAVHEEDRLIGELIASLKNNHLYDNTILVIAGDHGESFHENYAVTHGKFPYEHALRTSIMITNLTEPKTETYPMSLVDITPTVLAALGYKKNPAFQGIDILSQNRPPLNQRLIFFSVNSLALINGLVWGGRWKYIEKIDQQKKYLFDLKNDPGEKQNLYTIKKDIATALEDICTSWGLSQEFYYQTPKFHSQYHPIDPPEATSKMNTLWLSE